MKPRPATACVAYIHPGQVSAYFVESLLALALRDQRHGRRIVGLLQQWSSANVSQARNDLVRLFLDDRPGDYLLFIDADMSFPADALEELLSVADPVTAPIVGGLCFGKGGDGLLFATIYRMTEQSDGRPVTVRVADYPDDTMVPVAATGAAFLLIHRGVLEAMRERGFSEAFPWFQEIDLAGNPCGEDIAFCLRAGMLEFPVYVHTGVQIGHHKSHLLTAAMFRAQHPAELEEHAL